MLFWIIDSGAIIIMFTIIVLSGVAQIFRPKAYISMPEDLKINFPSPSHRSILTHKFMSIVI